MTKLEEKQMDIKKVKVEGEMEEKIWSKKIQFALVIAVSLFAIAISFIAYN